MSARNGSGPQATSVTLTIKAAAKAVNASYRMVRRVRAVKLRGNPMLAAAMQTKLLTLTAAEMLANCCDDEAIAYVLQANSGKERRRRIGNVWMAVRADNGRPGRHLPVVMTCRQCGEAFTAKRYSRQFCSNACRQAAYREREAAE
jgi:hypothetical protein